MKTIQDLIATAMYDYARYSDALNNAVHSKDVTDEEWGRLQERKEWTEAEVLKSLKALEDLGIDVPILKFLRK